MGGFPSTSLRGCTLGSMAERGTGLNLGCQEGEGRRKRRAGSSQGVAEEAGGAAGACDHQSGRLLILTVQPMERKEKNLASSNS